MDFTPCHTCDKRGPLTGGKIACLADRQKRDITELVPLGVCPHPRGPRFSGPPKLVPAGQSRGLGSDVARILTSLGVKKCGGCSKREEALNDLAPR